MSKYSYQDWRLANIEDLTKADKTPQFEQDAENCWLYSMCNNAYYNFKWDFRLADLIEVKKLMSSYGINIKWAWGWPLSWAFIAMYLSKKWDVPVRCFQIDFFKDTLKFSELFRKWIVFEMARFNNPMLYTDAFDDWKVNKVYHTWEATWWHSTNIYYEPEKRMLKELWTWGNDNKKNQFYYDILQFWNNIKTRAISSLFNFLAVLKDE